MGLALFLLCSSFVMDCPSNSPANQCAREVKKATHRTKGTRGQGQPRIALTYVNWKDGPASIVESQLKDLSSLVCRLDSHNRGLEVLLLVEHTVIFPLCLWYIARSEGCTRALIRGNLWPGCVPAPSNRLGSQCNRALHTRQYKSMHDSLHSTIPTGLCTNENLSSDSVGENQANVLEVLNLDA